MNRRLICALIASAAAAVVSARQIVMTMTPAQIEEAIRLANDEKAARAFLLNYVVQARSGMGTGPLLGYVSTPFARVVRAALVARAKGTAFDAADVTSDLISPQLDVLVLNQSAAYSDLNATVQSVSITVGNQAIEPESTKAATPVQYRLFGLKEESERGIVAVFPLEAATSGNTIRVTYSQVVRGSSAITNCQSCSAPFFSARLR